MTEPADALVRCILTLSEEAEKITANPLVVTPTGRWLLPYWDTLECEGNHTSAAFEGGTYKNVTAASHVHLPRAHSQLAQLRTSVVRTRTLSLSLSYRSPLASLRS